MSLDPTEGTGASFRVQRLRWSWLLALPYFLLARPSTATLLAGAVIALPGLLLRSWAAGFIYKEMELATEGPYRFIRHPLYAGTLLLGLGLATAGGRWWFLPAYGALFAWVYGRTLKAEDQTLEYRFGPDYRVYRDRVPAFLPRPPSRAGGRAEPPAGPGSEAASRPGLRPRSSRFWDVSGLHSRESRDGPGPHSRGFRPWLYRRNREWQVPLGILIGFALLLIKRRWLG